MTCYVRCYLPEPIEVAAPCFPSAVVTAHVLSELYGHHSLVFKSGASVHSYRASGNPDITDRILHKLPNEVIAQVMDLVPDQTILDIWDAVVAPVLEGHR